MSKRLYIGRIPRAAQREDLVSHFRGLRIVDVRLLGGFGFVEFETPREAEDAIRDFNGRDFMGESLIVEYPRESRKRDVYDGGRGGPRGPPPRRGVRVRVVGIPDNTSWQDLKDYGRIGNPNVMFADVDRNNRSTGIIEFSSMTDAEDAMHRLAGVDINNTPVRLELAFDVSNFHNKADDRTGRRVGPLLGAMMNARATMAMIVTVLHLLTLTVPLAAAMEATAQAAAAMEERGAHLAATWAAKTTGTRPGTMTVIIASFRKVHVINMPLLDPFSAASRPFIAFDALPSNPLQFGETLQPRDQNVHAQVTRLPRETISKRQYADQLPSDLPEPLYGHRRVSSVSSLHSDFSQAPPTGTDEWMADKMAECLDKASRVLDFSRERMERLSPRIADFQHIVTLPSSPAPSPAARAIGKFPSTPRSPGTASARWQRTVSAPASSGLLRDLPVRPSTLRGQLLDSPTITEASEDTEPGDAKPLAPFTRSKTGVVDLGERGLEIYLGHNLLQSALFEITKLHVLILRNNQLDRLPSAIGALHHLKELNISGNRITMLPNTILQLNLETFSAHPNPWLPMEGRFSPLKAHSSNIASLADICRNMLISPRGSNRLPPLLEHYRFEAAPGQRHPLLDAQALHDALPFLPLAEAEMALQVMQSCSAQARRAGMRNELFPRSNQPPAPDNASTNPFFEPCPSPRHRELRQTPYGQALQSLFIKTAEERIEWRDVFGIAHLPVLWKGCSPGCLDFLERDEWDLDSEFGAAW